MTTAAFIAVLRKEFLQILRDKRLLPLLLVAPILQVLAFGYAVNFDVDNIITKICDHDRTPLTRGLAESLFAEGTFKKGSEPPQCSTPEADLRLGNAQAIITFPAGFARDLLGEKSVQIQAWLDGSNPVVGRYAANALMQFAQNWSLKIGFERKALLQTNLGTAIATASIRPETRLFFNPEMKSSIFMVPGVAALVLVVVTMIATAMGISREKEMGTLEQVSVTPIGVPELLLGKTLPFVLFGLIDILAVLVLSVYVFEVPVRGSLFLYFFATALYLLNTVGIGLLVSTVSANQQQALLTGFFLLMPGILLSGVFTPISAMPGWMQPITYINPIRFYGEILRGIMLKGSSFYQLLPSFLGLAIFDSAVFFLAVMRFSKRTL